MIRFENRENGRFYYMVVESDITNKFVLNIIRGGKHVRVITSITLYSDSMVRAEIDKRSKRRIRNGYSLVT